MSQKSVLREEIKKLLNKTPVEEFIFQGTRAVSLIRSSPVWSTYATVLLFLSMKAEIETQFLLELALQDGKAVFAPRVEGESLAFYQISSPDGPWSKGPFGIREPGGPRQDDGKSGAVTSRNFPALIITPGLAFDGKGNRLGRGKGYYDRCFAELDRKGCKYFALGLCMDFQVVDHLPAGERDKRMHGLLTGEKLDFF